MDSLGLREKLSLNRKSWHLAHSNQFLYTVPKSESFSFPFQTSVCHPRIDLKMATGKLIVVVLLSAIIVVTQSLPFLKNNLDVTKNKCGIRSLGVPLNNATQASNFNVEYFRTQPESFPWIVKLVLESISQNSNEKLLLCTGVAVSRFVAIFPAHCVAGNEKSRLTVVQRHFLFLSSIFVAVWSMSNF